MSHLPSIDTFKTRTTIKIGKQEYVIFSLGWLKKAGLPDPEKLPVSLRILLENLLRLEDGLNVKREDIEALASWNPKVKSEKEIAFVPARVLLQDFTGVPAIVDLAAMRDAIKRMGGNPEAINPIQPVDLVIDHSIQVESFGTDLAFRENAEREFRNNLERYRFLRWGQRAFRNFRVVPPETGIVHQVNLEYLAQVVFTKTLSLSVIARSEATKQSKTEIASPRYRGARNDERVEVLAYPDTLVGADSHTTMINALGVLGWGVGGIEAEAAMLGQPISMLIPEVIGFKLFGHLEEGTTATDLVLTITQMLRKKGVVGKFVEFYGPGLDSLSLPDRATVANMCPEYGATVGFFPVDQETLDYLRLTGRDEELVKRVEIYMKEQGLFRTSASPDPQFSDTFELDLGTVEPSLAGPRRPQDRVSLKHVKESFRKELSSMLEGKKRVSASHQTKSEIDHGSVVIAAITSCTNTSNPQVMIGAGLLAKKAVDRGLAVKPWVKTSLAPGSKVVMDYLRETKLLEALEKLKFHLVGFGCTTCIGNSGPLPDEVGQAVKVRELVVAAVLSGNRNFEGRINPLVRANYLASPPLVVAYAIAGSMNVDLVTEPLGKDRTGKPVYLREIWPSQAEINREMGAVTSKMFRKQYARVFDGDENWKSIEVPTSVTFVWDSKSTYVKHPPFFADLALQPKPLQDIRGARVLAVLGDSVTTDHISPAGSIAKESPAGEYLIEHGVDPKDFNSYGARRGNYEVMVRGTFANIRLRNLLVPGVEGGWTKHFPPLTLTLSPKGRGKGEGKGEFMSIFDAAMKYRKEEIPLIVIAGKEYGAGSSRDWAAKGPALLGVKAVIAESFERIHRSNLIGMGILPLEFESASSLKTLGLSGEETFDILGVRNQLQIGAKLVVCAKARKGEKKFSVRCRIDTPAELSYYQHGGILPYVLRKLLSEHT